jgi:hypothetical protein
MTPAKDKNKVRIVGALSLAIGAILMAFTVFGTLFVLFSGPSTNYGRAMLSFGVLIILSSCLMSCGTQLTRLRLYTSNDIQTMRLNWTALVLVTAIGGAIAFWVIPPVVDVCVIELLLLFAEPLSDSRAS